MPTINLRPWREELRAKRQKDFLTMLVATLIVSGLLVFLWQTNVTSQIEYQKSRNNYLTTSMKELDKKIKEIEELRSQRKQLLSRMKVIQDLQGTRPIIVRVFDELARTLPDGLYYKSLTKKNNSLSIQGMAESNNRISALMRNFESSQWFSAPNLKDVSSDKKQDGLNRFAMTVNQVTPEPSKDKKGAK